MRNTIFWDEKKIKIGDGICINMHEPIEEYQNNSMSFHIGAEILGPILTAFCVWVNSVSENYDYIVFLSREGKTIFEAYKVLYPNETHRLRNLYVSRRSLIVPQLKNVRKYDEFIETLLPLLQDSSIKGLCSLIDDSELLKELEFAGIESDEDILLLEHHQKEVLMKKIEERKELFSYKYNLVKQYLLESIPQGTIAFVDVGWQGTIQKEILKYTKIYSNVGLYLGVRDKYIPNKASPIERRGLFFAPGVNKRNDYIFRFSTDVVELLFSDLEGTTIGYSNNDGVIIPLLDEAECVGENRNKLLEIRNTAFREIEQLRDRFAEYSMDEILQEIMIAFYNFAICPSNKVIHFFDTFKFKYTQTEKLLPSKSAIYYFFHLKEFNSEIHRSGCKIMALKKVFKLSLPYFQILYFLGEFLGVKGRQYWYFNKKKVLEDNTRV